MEVLQELLGTWKLIPGTVEGYCDFLDALEFSAPVRETHLQHAPRPQTFSFEARREGRSDFYTLVVHCGELSFIHTFRLHTPIHCLTADGDRSETEYFVDNNRRMLIGQHKTGRHTVTSRRYLKDGCLVSEAETETGIVSRLMLQKVPQDVPYRRDKRVQSIISLANSGRSTTVNGSTAVS